MFKVSFYFKKKELEEGTISNVSALFIYVQGFLIEENP